MEVTWSRGRRRRKLQDDLKDARGYSHLKEEALDRTMWRAPFGRGFGPVGGQTTEWWWWFPWPYMQHLPGLSCIWTFLSGLIYVDRSRSVRN
jgi:hypothetical protein